jgi:hypothetical protein
MEHLRELYVVDLWCVTRDFFDNLDLPCLRSLEYMSEGVPGDFPFTPLLPSANALQRLALSVERVTSGTVIGCLRLVPALRELVIRYDRFSFESVALDNSLWTSLTPTAQNLEHVLCPGLQSMKFVEFSATSDNALLEFIQARTGPNFAGIARLSKVQAHFRRRMQVDIAPTLQQAIDDGLDLSLRYEYPSPRTYSPWEQILAHSGGERPSDRWGGVPPSFIAP